MSIKFENVGYFYTKNNPIIDNISFKINQGEKIGLIGVSGSGKSTLLCHLNALLKPSFGNIYYNDKDINAKGFSKRALRFDVGAVFQYPEQQLFRNTVVEDVCFGLEQMGIKGEEKLDRAKEALISLGISEPYFNRSPQELSGGEKRRVAVAGVLAMKPKVLVLDEPTAGLDPAWRKELLEPLYRGGGKEKMTIILVSHIMEDIARYSERVLVINGGRLVMDGSPREVFLDERLESEYGINPPVAVSLNKALHKRGIDLGSDILLEEDFERAVIKRFKERCFE